MACSAGIILRALVIIIFGLFNSGTVGRWVSLFSIFIALLVIPILFNKCFIIYAHFIISTSSTFSFTIIYLCKKQSFGCRRFGHDYFTVFFQYMKSLWTGFGVQFVPGGEFIMNLHLQIAMLCTTISHLSIGQLSFFSFYMDICLLLLRTFIKIQ